MADHKVIIKSKFFDELSTGELYEIMKARAEIFVVEQNCVYQDLDDLDYRSLHVFCQEDGIVTAYLRVVRWRRWRNPLRGEDANCVEPSRVIRLR